MFSPSGSRRSATIVALDELRRREDLESLRKYLIEENCFPALKDPNTSIITMEELKKLARIWKLNERRNFWKEHSDRNDMVAALLNHVEQNLNYSTNKIKLEGTIDFLATPPTDRKPSSLSTRQAYAGAQLKNYCGKKYFNRESNDNELVLSSRFYDFPTPSSEIGRVIDNWRDEDFELRDESQEAAHAASHASTQNTYSSSNRKSRVGGANGIKNKARIVKHRNLSTHLMNYSANPELNKSNLSLKAIQTFINVSDSDDPTTVSNCMIALSNVASSDHVRSLLFEVNALHKFTNMLQYIRGKAALRAAGLLFYYFSCDKETEDRVYNSCSSFLQANGASKDPETRMLSLYSLNNLMPCIDRARVADITMRIIHAQFENCMATGDKALLCVFLLIMQNMCCFSNVHATLIGLNLLELIAQVASYAISQKNSDLAMGVLKIMQAFLQAPEQAAHLVTLEYVQILMTLLASHDEVVLVQSMRVATILTTLSPLRHLISLSKIVRTISRTVSELPQISTKLCKAFAKFYVNVTLEESPQGMDALLEGDIHNALLRLFNESNATFGVKAVAVRAVQNLISVPAVGIKLASLFFEHLVRFLCEAGDIGAAMALFNISCIPQCRTELVEAKVHLRLLEFMVQNRDQVMKSALLQVLVQMSSSNVCVLELLKEGLIVKLETQIKGVTSGDIWNDVSLMLLAVVAFAAKDLNEVEEVSVVRILQIICVPGVPDKVLENCSNVLKYISVRFSPFMHLSPVVRAILGISSADNEEVVEHISNVLYNMTCSDDNIASMLQDSQYVDIMIHIMRNGNLEVQENIAQCMRNFCANPKCIEILLHTDILSDLIVIALLRTSSEEIKVVCSEAFYNMLCHHQTRLQLLKGDLWWAIMRLCRGECNQVRNTCARALFDLSTDAGNVSPLRSHHILSFVRDIIINGTEEFLQVCLRSVHNLVRQYGIVDNLEIANHEVIATIRIGTEVLSRLKNLDYVRDALVLLLHCALPGVVCDGAAHEFINLDLIDVLERSKAIWSLDRQCRIYVSRLLWELSKSEQFTKGTFLWDMDPILCACYQSEPLFEICDNLAAQFLQHVLREAIPPERLINLPVWSVLLKEGLSSESSVLPSAMSMMSGMSSKRSPMPGGSSVDQLAVVTKNLALSRSGSHSFGAFRERSATTHDSQTVDPMIERVFNTKSAVLSVLAYCVREMIATTPDKITRSLIQGILQNDLLDHNICRANLLIVISALSANSTFTGYLLDCRVLQLLHRHLMNSVGTARYAQAQEFCSTFLRNMSLHSSLVPRYVSSADGMICELIRELLEVPMHVVHMDLAVFFFNSSGHLVKNELSLNPKFVLDMIGKISNIDSDGDSEVTGINKFTISMVLNKYSFGTGVEPNYVQYMFSYMQQPSSQHTPAYMESVTFNYAVDLKATLLPDFLQSKQSVQVDLKTFAPDSNLWKPTITTESKRHENIILKFANPEPIVHIMIEQLEGTAGTSVVFGKIFKEFEALKESVGATDNNAIAEADEAEEEDEESLEGGSLQEAGEDGMHLDEEGIAVAMGQIMEESSVSSTESSARGTPSPRPEENSGSHPSPGQNHSTTGAVSTLPTVYSSNNSRQSNREPSVTDINEAVQETRRSQVV